MIEDIKKKIEDSFDEMIVLLEELIKCDTVNPPGNEYLGVKVIQDFLHRYNIPYEIHKREKGRENIIVRIGTGNPAVFSAGHIDVVPPGDLDKWDHPPFEPVRKGDMLYGRGSTDNKGPLAALFIIVKVLWEYRDRITGTFIASGVADEEKGSYYGTEYLMEKGLIDCNYALIPDIGGNMKVMDVAEKGVLDIKITTFGRSAHGSTPELGINAISKMADIIKALENYRFEYESHKYLSPPTMNIGVIKGGEASNMVCDRCEIIVNIRYLPSQTSQGIRDGFEKELKKIDENIKVEIERDLNPTEVNPDSAFIKSICDHTKQEIGIEPQLIGIGGATVCKTFINKGIPAVGWGPGENAHVPNEYVNLNELMQFAKIFAGVLVKILT